MIDILTIILAALAVSLTAIMIILFEEDYKKAKAGKKSMFFEPVENKKEEKRK